MKFSENTLAILKNFASINMSQTNVGGIVLNPGNYIATISPALTISAEATIDETIPQKFSIYELNKFIANVQNLGGSDAEFEFQGDKVIITDPDGMVMEYQSAVEDFITKPEKSMPSFEPDVTVNIEWEKLQKILKLAALNKFTDIGFYGSEDGIFMETFQPTNENNVRIRLRDNTEGVNFEASSNKDFFNILPLNYTIDFCLKMGFMRLTSGDGKIVYHILLNRKGKSHAE